MTKHELRKKIFTYLDGVVISPITYTLLEKNLLDAFSTNKKQDLSLLSKKYSANEGYLNVALRALASQGFLNYQLEQTSNTIFLSANENTPYFLKNATVYNCVIPYLKATSQLSSQNFDLSQLPSLEDLLEKSKNNFGITLSDNQDERIIQQQILTHLEGAIVSPLIVQLGMRGFFHKYFMESSFQAGEFHKNPELFETILDYLSHLHWFTKNGSHYQFTEIGEYYAKRAASYGVTVSYLPLFSKLDELIFGNPKKLREISENEDEIHVDRKMNVWGSGGAHSTYFKVVTDFMVEIFNQPLDKQPKGILDMGCGNGAFIQHIFETIERHTLRGKNLEEYPLFLVGADYNQAALKVTRANLINADIWAKIIWGDIGNPEKLAQDLKNDYNINLEDLLNIRTFLDHNRIWENPESHQERESSSTGAFAFRGERLNNAAVEENLKNHLMKWLPYIKKNGLLVIELHTLDPEIVQKNIGETAATAYDATHGFSDQYILEIDVFQKICKEVGLKIDDHLFKKYPNSNLATVSINLLKA